MQKKVIIRLKNGEETNFEIPYGTNVKELLQHLNDKKKYIAAKVNNEITSLSFSLKVNSSVEFLTAKDNLGMEVYRRSLSFLLAKVCAKLYPERRLVIGHSLGPGYYFEFDMSEVKKIEVKEIEAEMRKEIDANIPIIRERISYIDALEYFKNINKDDKYKLLLSQNMSKLSIYKCEDFVELYDGPIVSQTGMLKCFSLIYYSPGFVLQFPKKSDPNQVAQFTEQKKIFSVYHESKEQGKVLKVDNVGSLNEIIMNKQIDNFIQVAEALQSRKIVKLASEIHNRKDTVRLITIAGPSSSGKTTFSKKLAIELQAFGLKPLTISIDNYFVDRSKTPLDEDGKPDYEALESLNIEMLNDNLNSLINGKKIRLPVYNFMTGLSSLSDRELSINPDEIIVIEGIHCLNEKLTYVIKPEHKYKIYISALTQMNIDDNNRIPTTDNRILRRMVRDYKYRGHSAKKTFQMWPSVRRGEEKHIFPFQNDADGYFNSALDYELAVLRSYAEPILRQIKPFDEEYAEAIRLLRFLGYFLMVPPKNVPPTSILREFIGGSFFDY
jgi:uridine kinase